MSSLTAEKLKEIEAREALFTRAAECVSKKEELDKILDDLVARNKIAQDRIAGYLRERDGEANLKKS